MANDSLQTDPTSNRPADHQADGQAEVHQARWYALKVFHNKSMRLETDLTENLSMECYLPKKEVIKLNAEGKQTSRTVPAVTGLLFVHIADNSLAELRRRIDGQALLYSDTHGRPAVIPQREMTMFRLVTSSGDQGLEYLPEASEKFAVGQLVRVTGGPFKGAEGHICRIRGNRRLIVMIHGVCAVATSYVPACFIQKL